MSPDGARDGAEMCGLQRGGTWAPVRGVDAGETCGMAMYALRGLGCMWHVHEGHGQGCGPETMVWGQRWRYCQWMG